MGQSLAHDRADAAYELKLQVLKNATQTLHETIDIAEKFMQKVHAKNPEEWDNLDDMELIKHVGKLRDNLMDARKDVIRATKDMRKAKRKYSRASLDKADQAQEHLEDSAVEVK